MTDRAIFYDDGFNLYHAIDDLQQPHLKWLSLRSLAEAVIRRRQEHVEAVLFFSATPSHLGESHPDKLLRHNTYIRALEATGVECHLGRFKIKRVHCHNCNHEWTSAEEKHTDVHIGARLLEDAFLDKFDTAYLISNDTDLVPALAIFKRNFPDKQLVGLSAPHRHYPAELSAIMDRRQRLRPALLARHLLPARLTHPDGKTVFRPSAYDP